MIFLGRFSQGQRTLVKANGVLVKARSLNWGARRANRSAPPQAGPSHFDPGDTGCMPFEAASTESYRVLTEQTNQQ